MQHNTTARLLFCLPLLLTSYALADEPGDRAAIVQTVTALNEFPHPSTLFTDDASSDLDRLPNVRPLAFRVMSRPAQPALHPPHVTISHEPWGEASIGIPLPQMEILNPRITVNSIRFLTPEIALVDGNWTYHKDIADTQTIPLLFIMKKETDSWKIASLRLLAEPL